MGVRSMFPTPLRFVFTIILVREAQQMIVIQKGTASLTFSGFLYTCLRLQILKVFLRVLLLDYGGILLFSIVLLMPLVTLVTLK